MYIIQYCQTLLPCHVEVPLCVRADPAALLPAGGRHHQHPPVPHEALPPAQRQAQRKLDFTLNFYDEVDSIIFTFKYGTTLFISFK